MRTFCRLLLILVSVLALQRSDAETLPPSESPALEKSDPIERLNQIGERVAYLKIDGTPSITLKGCSNIIIFCCDLRSIVLEGCHDIVIQNCWIHDDEKVGIIASQCKNISIQGCRIENVSSGLYAVDSFDLQFFGNYVENVRGPYPRGQMVQFDNVRGSHNAVRNNYGINFFGQSTPEDMINMYQSAGEPESPIVIENNYLCGDPVYGSQGKSKTGSGIMLGDSDGNGGGSGGYLVCRNNIVINAGQVGIGVAGGDAITVEKNTVIGTQSDVSNVGLYAWNQSKVPGGTVTITKNYVFWINRDGQQHSFWKGGGFAKVRVTHNEFDNKNILSQLPKPPTKVPFPPSPVTLEKSGDQVIQLPWVPRERAE